MLHPTKSQSKKRSVPPPPPPAQSRCAMASSSSSCSSSLLPPPPPDNNNDDYGLACSGAGGCKRLRRPNFKFQELEMMVALLEERPELASGKIGGAYINADAQRHAWQEVATLVSAVGEVQRSAREIREKWIDYKSRVKQKLRKIRDQEEGHAEPGALPVTLTPLELRILHLAKKNARHGNEDPDLYINCYEGPEPTTTTHGSYQHPSFKLRSGASPGGSFAGGAGLKSSLLHPEMTFNLLDDDEQIDDEEEELVEEDEGETGLGSEQLPSHSQDSNDMDAISATKPIIMIPSQELVSNESTPVVLSSVNGPGSQVKSEFQVYSREGSESSFAALTNEDGDSAEVEATATPPQEPVSEEFPQTLTDRLLTHLAHKQDRVVGLLTELTEETYRRRCIEEETLGLLRTLVALQARRVELEELRMGLSGDDELARRTMTNHSSAQGSRTSK